MKVKKLNWVLFLSLFSACKPDSTLITPNQPNQFKNQQTISDSSAESRDPSPISETPEIPEVEVSEENDDLSFHYKKTIRKLEHLIHSNVDDLYYLVDELSQKTSFTPPQEVEAFRKLFKEKSPEELQKLFNLQPQMVADLQKTFSSKTLGELQWIFSLQTQEARDLQKLFNLQRSELFDEIEPVYFQCQQAKTDTQKTECIRSYHSLVKNLEARFEKEYHEDVLQRKQKHRFYQSLISYLTLSNPFLNFFSKFAGPTPPDSYSQMSDHFWGQNIVASDLARKFIHHYYGNFSKLDSDLQVAILDDFSKFNSGPFHAKASNGTLSYSPKGLLNAEGHGFSVTSFIVGKSEVGVSNLPIRLAWYKSPDSGLFSAMYDICEQQSKTSKITLINLSIGLENDSFGEVTFGDWLSKMAKMGCLIIKAGGNQGHLYNNTEYSLADSYLRVEAADNWGDRVFLSTRGEIPAPGYDVWGFSEDGGSEKCNPYDLASTERCQFTSGTSYSAPMVTGIAIQIAHVLNSSEKFSNLPPEERVALVAAVLKASTDAYPNALRAIRIAELWNTIPSEPEGELSPFKKNGGITFSAANRMYKFDLLKEEAPSILRFYLKKWPAPICEQKNLLNYDSLFESSDKLTQRIDQAREYLALCDDQHSPQVALDLVKAYLNQGKDQFAYSIAADALIRFNQASPISQEIIQLTVKRFFDNVLPIKKFLDPVPEINVLGRKFWSLYLGFKLSPGFTRRFLQPYLDSFKGRPLTEMMPRQDFEALIEGVIHSIAFQVALAQYPEKKLEVRGLLQVFIQTVVSFLGEDEGKRILLESITNSQTAKEYRQFLEEIVNTARAN